MEALRRSVGGALAETLGPEEVGEEAAEGYRYTDQEPLAEATEAFLRVTILRARSFEPLAGASRSRVPVTLAGDRRYADAPAAALYNRAGLIFLLGCVLQFILLQACGDLLNNLTLCAGIFLKRFREANDVT
jgi:hypothetical protein